MMNGRSNGKALALIKYISENNIRVITDTLDTAEKIWGYAKKCKINIPHPMSYDKYLKEGCSEIKIFVTRVSKPQLNGLIAFNEPINNIWLKEIENEWEW